MGEISSSSGSIICFFLYQIYIVKCFVVLNEVSVLAFGHLNTVTSLCTIKVNYLFNTSAR